MKIYRFLLIAILILAVLMTTVIGCKYDVAPPQWDKPAPEATTPAITGVVPSQGTAGVNIITIQGQQFGDSLKDITVYFDNTQPEIIALSSTSIIVRRPNLVSAAATIKVVSSKALMAVKYSPYVLDSAWERYGTFIDNTSLGAIAVDSVENVYVLSSVSPYKISKVAPGGAMTTFTPSFVSPALSRATADVKIHNGIVYLLGAGTKVQTGMRDVQVLDLTTNQITRAYRVPNAGTGPGGSGGGVNFGDFDSYGNFYVGGNTTDLCVVPPNPPALPTVKAAGNYLADEILAVRVFNGNGVSNVYVASRPSSGATPIKIYKHSIDAAGNLGAQTLVLDLATTAFASRKIKGLTISSNGILFIVTEAADPILVFDPVNNSIDYFYKNLISHVITTTTQTAYWFGKQACWGTGNNMYMIANDTTSASDDAFKWNVMKIKMGTAGSPYY